MCFSIDLEDNNYDIGRGGNGESKFTFALLDWTSGGSNSRRTQYMAAGGDLDKNNRLTKHMWVAKFGTQWRD